MTPEEKAARARQRMLDKAREYTLKKYLIKFVSPQFHPMIRAEAAARWHGEEWAFVDGSLKLVLRNVGQCVCVTCGRVEQWNGGLFKMHTGHFIAGRYNAIIFDEDNVAPQCHTCNWSQSGEPQKFRLWMIAVRGMETVERLERQRNETRIFDREELVDMRIAFQSRLKAAEERMKT